MNDADRLSSIRIAERPKPERVVAVRDRSRSPDKFQLVFRQVLESLFIERMELNDELFADYMTRLDL